MSFLGFTDDIPAGMELFFSQDQSTDLVFSPRSQLAEAYNGITSDSLPDDYMSLDHLYLPADYVLPARGPRILLGRNEFPIPTTFPRELNKAVTEPGAFDIESTVIDSIYGTGANQQSLASDIVSNSTRSHTLSTQHSKSKNGRRQNASHSTLARTKSDSGAKGFKCTMCSKEIEAKHEYNKHLKRHIKPHKCSVGKCTFQSTSKSDLKRHYATVHPDSASVAGYFVCPDGCEACKSPKKRWPRGDNFRTHLRKVHLINEPDINKFYIASAQAPSTQSTVAETSLTTSTFPMSIEPTSFDTFYDRTPGNFALQQPNTSNSFDSSALNMKHSLFGCEPFQSKILPVKSFMNDIQTLHCPTSSSRPAIGANTSHWVTDSAGPQLAYSIEARGSQSVCSMVDALGDHSGRNVTETSFDIANGDAGGNSDGGDEGGEGEGDNGDIDSIMSGIETHSYGEAEGDRRNGLQSPNSHTLKSSVSQLARNPIDKEAIKQFLSALSNKGLLTDALEEIGLRQPEPEMLAEIPGGAYARDVTTKPDENRSKSCDFSGCSKSFKTTAELKKHQRRHLQPFGCTFKCKGTDNKIKTFGSKNDWKRHEMSQHINTKKWQCNVTAKNADGKPEKSCKQTFSNSNEFVKHLVDKHGMTDSKTEGQVKSCQSGHDHEPQFWCGFCQKTIKVQVEGNEDSNDDEISSPDNGKPAEEPGSAEAGSRKALQINNRRQKTSATAASTDSMLFQVRFDHIGDHFISKDNRMDICQWKADSGPEENVVRRKMISHRAVKVIDSGAAARPKSSKPLNTSNRVWLCHACRAHCGLLKTSNVCLDCGHDFCRSCDILMAPREKAAR